MKAYFISFAGPIKDINRIMISGIGFDNTEVVRKTPIKTFDDIKELELEIAKQRGVEYCTILNYKELEDTNEGFFSQLLSRERRW